MPLACILTFTTFAALNVAEQGAQPAAADPGTQKSEGGLLAPHDGFARKAAPSRPYQATGLRSTRFGDYQGQFSNRSTVKQHYRTPTAQPQGLASTLCPYDSTPLPSVLFVFRRYGLGETGAT